MGGVWLPETRLPPWGSFGRRPGSSGRRLARCCSREARSAAAEEAGARSCLPSAPYVRLLALGAGRRFARLGTARDSRGPELRRRPGPSPAGGEAPGLRPCLRPRSERLAGECGCAHRRLPPRRPGATALLRAARSWPASLRPSAGRGLAGSSAPLSSPWAGVTMGRRVTPAALAPSPGFTGSLAPASSPPFALGAWVVLPVSFEPRQLSSLENF